MTELKCFMCGKEETECDSFYYRVTFLRGFEAKCCSCKDHHDSLDNFIENLEQFFHNYVEGAGK